MAGQSEGGDYTDFAQSLERDISSIVTKDSANGHVVPPEVPITDKEEQIQVIA